MLITKGRLLLNKAPGNLSRVGFSMSEDFQEGLRLLAEAIDLALEAGHRRQLMKIETIRNSLFRQGKRYMDAVEYLNNKLDGPDSLTRTIVD